MPFRSNKQRRYIYYLRGKYSNKKNTPKKFKWIWSEDWGVVSENKVYKFKSFVKKFSNFSNNMGFQKIISDKKEDFLIFIKKFKNHLKDNKKASLILYKYVKGDIIEENDLDFFKKQTYDFIKSIGVGIPTIILPGGILLLSFIIWLSNYFEIDILPKYLKKNDDLDDDKKI